MWISPKTDFEVFELDELYWFINKKARTETRENTYIMTMISRIPRQITGFAVEIDKSSHRLQKIVDSVAPANRYCTDGYFGYMDVNFPGKHLRNVYDKSDTHNVESINSDLRHYIPGLARRSRCFFRNIETLRAVLGVFIEAYNKYGEAKQKYRVLVKHKSANPAKHLHEYRDLPFSVFDFSIRTRLCHSPDLTALACFCMLCYNFIYHEGMRDRMIFQEKNQEVRRQLYLT
jgi:IS1 family transposase